MGGTASVDAAGDLRLARRSPLEFKSAYSVGDLLLQHLDTMECEAAQKGRIQQALANHFAKLYKVSMSLAA